MLWNLPLVVVVAVVVVVVVAAVAAATAGARPPFLARPEFQDCRIRVESDIPLDDRIAMQPCYDLDVLPELSIEQSVILMYQPIFHFHLESHASELSHRG